MLTVVLYTNYETSNIHVICHFVYGRLHAGLKARINDVFVIFAHPLCILQYSSTIVLQYPLKVGGFQLPVHV